MEIAQGKGAQFTGAFTAQYRFGLIALLRRNKGRRWLGRQANMAWAVIGRQPEFDFCASGCIAPVAGQEKSLL